MCQDSGPLFLALFYTIPLESNAIGAILPSGMEGSVARVTMKKAIKRLKLRGLHPPSFAAVWLSGMLIALGAGCSTLSSRHAIPDASTKIETGDGIVQVWDRGSGPAVVLLPTRGRSVMDFQPLAAKLNESGYRTLSINLRGVGQSTGRKLDTTLADLAEDVNTALMHLAPGRSVHVVGHGLGEKVARVLASRHPVRVRSLILLGADADGKVESEIVEDLNLIYDPNSSRPQRAVRVRHLMFVSRQAAAKWRGGWDIPAGQFQAEVLDNTRSTDWLTPPDQVPCLVLQGLEDRIEPPEEARKLALRARGRTRFVALEKAGHALHVEQPQEVAGKMVTFLDSLDSHQLILPPSNAVARNSESDPLPVLDAALREMGLSLSESVTMDVAEADPKQNLQSLTH